jgi:hypothetical protein
MRLIKLEILPRGIHGWGSTELVFGKHITSIFAKNGSGKTPVVQALVHSLGYPVVFRDDVVAKCAATRLTCEVNSEVIVFERQIGSEFLVTVVTLKGEAKSFDTERSFSDYFFALFGLSLPELVGINKLSVRPYISTTLPIFYLDQDQGYGAIYKAKNNFIRDQFVETIRFLFGFEAKNSFANKKDLLRLKEERDSIDQKIVFQQGTVERLRADQPTSETIEELDSKLAGLKAQLEQMRGGVSLKDDANSALGELYSSKVQRIQRTTSELDNLKARVDGISRIGAEILAEADTLSLNEEARRVFMSFKDICANENCCLFVGSSQSYAKNLLYLKDQLKDLERNAEAASNKIEVYEIQLLEQKAELNALAGKIKQNANQSDTTGLVDAVQAVTREIIEISKRRAQIQAADVESNIYLKLLNRREELHNKIAAMSSGSDRDIEFSKFRVSLKEKIVHWLDILAAKNVKRNIGIDLDLRIDFGGEEIDAIKGSTKVRIILAVHAALLQIYLERSGNFRFLILDTPVQHEIQHDDLTQYFIALKKLVQSSNAQVVLSSTEFRYPCDAQDSEWIPKFLGPEQPMYFGVNEDIIKSSEDHR